MKQKLVLKAKHSAAVNACRLIVLSDEEHLRRTLYKLDSVLDELMQRTEGQLPRNKVINK